MTHVMPCESHMASHVSQGMARTNACVTHGKPCVIRYAKANACVWMHANGHAYKMGGQFIEEGRSRKERRRKKKRERKETKKEREKEKKNEEKEGEKRKFAFRRSELVGPRSKVRGLYSKR